MTRVNLIENPSAAVNTNGWEAKGNANISRVEVDSNFGKTAFKVRFTSTDADSGIHSNTYIDVVPSVVYSFSVYPYIQNVSIEDKPITLRLRVEWYGPNSTTPISSNTSNPVVVHPSDGWADNRLSLVAQAYDAGGTGTAKATRALVYVYRSETGDGGVEVLLDGFLMEQSDYVGQFFTNLTQAQENKYVNKALTPVPFPNITGMQLNADISIGDLTLNTIDEDGTVWVCTGIDGWWTSAPPEVPDITRGTRDGSYSVTGRRAARQVTLNGVFLPQDPANIATARNRLVKTIDLVRKSTWLRTNETPTKASKVWLIGEPSIQTVNARGRTEFSIPLRAPDPIKYEWNDSDPDGKTTISILPTTNRLGRSLVTDDGDTSVSAELSITGPLGTGSYIDSSGKSKDQAITTAFRLRKSGALASIINMSYVDEVVTVTTDYKHGLQVGDSIILSGIPGTFNPTKSQAYVTSVSDDSEPYTFTYSISTLSGTSGDIPISGAYVALENSDVLLIDTYNQSVTFNGDTSGHRSKLEPLIDWIELEPGYNLVGLTESLEPFAVRFKSYNASTGVATLVVDRRHNLLKDEAISIALPEEATIQTSQITDNIATLSTEYSHGYSVADKIDVVVTTAYGIVSKGVDAHTDPSSVKVTLKTDTNHDMRVGSKIAVSLPVSASISAKKATATKVTLITSAAHGFSIGDSINLSLPTQGVISNRSVSDGVVSLTIPDNGFSKGDSIQVVLPTTVNVVSKTISGSSVLFSTENYHGYGKGDIVTVNLPTVASIVSTGTSYSWGDAAGGYLMTINTASSHKFDVGDKITLATTDTAPSWFTGTKIIESVPTSTSFTFSYYPTVTPSSGTLSNSTVTNVTNTNINGSGTRTLTTTSAYNFGFDIG